MKETQRKPLSKRLRFEVFKRDSFTCQYCGNTPPKVILEIDHLIPVSKKGTNNIDNLYTSCFDCNRGKSNIELTDLPQKTLQNMERIKEKQLQYKEYQKLLFNEESRIVEEVQQVDNIFKSYFPYYYLTDRFKVSIKNFIKQLGLHAVSCAMEKACSVQIDWENATKYFCGICWNIIKKNREGIK